MTEMPLHKRRRPPVYRLKGRVAGIFAIGVLGYVSDGWWWGVIAALMLSYLAITWLVARTAGSPGASISPRLSGSSDGGP